MKHSIHNIAFLFLLSSCGLQQRLSRRSQRQETQQQTTVHTDSVQLMAYAEVHYLRTADNQLQAELKPEGVFQYHPRRGLPAVQAVSKSV